MKALRILGLLVLSALFLVGCAKKNTIQVQITEITDVQTGQLVPADIYVDGEMVARGVTTDTFLVPIPGKIEVRHPDFETWSIIVNGKIDRTLSGPVELIPKPLSEGSEG
jgi:hypothetical protein